MLDILPTEVGTLHVKYLNKPTINIIERSGSKCESCATPGIDMDSNEEMLLQNTESS